MQQLACLDAKANRFDSDFLLVSLPFRPEVHLHHYYAGV